MIAYQIHKNDGTSYVVEMADSIDLEKARAYFVGEVYMDLVFTSEEPDRKETTWTCIDVTPAP